MANAGDRFGTSTPDDRDYTDSVSDAVKEQIISKTKHDRPKRKLMPFVIASYAVLGMIAMTLAIMSLRSSNENRDNLIVTECEQTNQSRKNTYEALMTLAILSVQFSDPPDRPVSPLIQRYVDYLNLAFDPVSCDPNSPDFGIDTTPPESLPVSDYFPGGPYSSSSTLLGPPDTTINRTE